MSKFFESPSNRTALAIWLATVITAALQYFLLHVRPPSADLLGLVIGLVKLIEPETAVTVPQLQRAMADLSMALATKSPAAIERVVADTQIIAAGITPPAKS
jgi:hypothetical protein